MDSDWAPTSMKRGGATRTPRGGWHGGGAGVVLGTGLASAARMVVAAAVISVSFFPSSFQHSSPMPCPQQLDPVTVPLALLSEKTVLRSLPVPKCPPCRFSNPQAHHMLSWLEMQIPRLYPRDSDLPGVGLWSSAFTGHPGACEAACLGAPLSEMWKEIDPNLRPKGAGCHAVSGPLHYTPCSSSHIMTQADPRPGTSEPPPLQPLGIG